MIQAENNFNSALKFIKDENSIYPSSTKEQMVSADFNNSMQTIENQLNNLYEKIRVLEDIRDYCKTFILEIIRLKEQEFKEKLKIIEDISDQYRDTEYISYTVPFEYSSEIIKDRDGTIINSMITTNNQLEQSGNISEKAVLSSITQESNTACYNNTYKNLINNESGRSYYIIDEPIYGGVLEKCSVLFNNSYECNFISISASNCTIKDCKIITLDDDSGIDIQNNEAFELTKIKGIQFSLVCTKYQFNSVEELNNLNDSYDSLYNNSYNRTSNTVIVKDMVSHSETVNKEKVSNDYLRDYKLWQKDKNIIDERNILLEGKE